MNDRNDWQSEIDWQEAVSRQHEQLRQNAHSERMAAAARSSDELYYDPEIKAELHKKRPYRKRPVRAGLGPDLSRGIRHVFVCISQQNDRGITSISVGELIDRTGYSRSQVQRSLKQLVEHKLLQRRIRPSSNPRRHLSSVLTLTPLGWTWLNRVPVASLSTDFSAQKLGTLRK